MKFIDMIYGMLGRIPQSFISLLTRLVVGLVFLKSGLTKVDGFHLSDSALFLFQEEYKLPLIDPWIAAHLATFNELVMSTLLIVGLLSRLAALVLLGMTLVIEIFVYPDAYVVHGLWAVALLTVIAHGPGKFSLDHLLKIDVSKRTAR